MSMRFWQLLLSFCLLSYASSYASTDFFHAAIQAKLLLYSAQAEVTKPNPCQQWYHGLIRRLEQSHIYMNKFLKRVMPELSLVTIPFSTSMIFNPAAHAPGRAAWWTFQRNYLHRVEKALNITQLDYCAEYHKYRRSLLYQHAPLLDFSELISTDLFCSLTSSCAAFKELNETYWLGLLDGDTRYTGLIDEIKSFVHNAIIDRHGVSDTTSSFLSICQDIWQILHAHSIVPEESNEAFISICVEAFAGYGYLWESPQMLAAYILYFIATFVEDAMGNINNTEKADFNNWIHMWYMSSSIRGLLFEHYKYTLKKCAEECSLAFPSAYILYPLLLNKIGLIANESFHFGYISKSYDPLLHRVQIEALCKEDAESNTPLEITSYVELYPGESLPERVGYKVSTGVVRGITSLLRPGLQLIIASCAAGYKDVREYAKRAFARTVLQTPVNTVNEAADILTNSLYAADTLLNDTEMADSMLSTPCKLDSFLKGYALLQLIVSSAVRMHGIIKSIPMAVRIISMDDLQPERWVIALAHAHFLRLFGLLSADRDLAWYVGTQSVEYAQRLVSGEVVTMPLNTYVRFRELYENLIAIPTVCVAIPPHFYRKLLLHGTNLILPHNIRTQNELLSYFDRHCLRDEQAIDLEEESLSHNVPAGSSESLAYGLVQASVKKLLPSIYDYLYEYRKILLSASLVVGLPYLVFWSRTLHAATVSATCFFKRVFSFCFPNSLCEESVL